MIRAADVLGLPDIRMDWSIRRVSELCEVVNGFPFASDDFAPIGELPLIRIRDLAADDFETYIPRRCVPSSAIIGNGDVIIGMDGDFNSVTWSRGEAALNQRLCLLRPRLGVDIRFVAYSLPEHLRVVNDLTYATTVKHLSSGDVRAQVIAIPPLDEQRQIAEYLDRETGKIDELITKQEQLVVTLTERRFASARQLVTRGLDSQVNFRDSGLEWLDSIPDHWKIGPLKRYGRLSTGGTPSTDVPENFDSDNGLPWVRPQDIDSSCRDLSWSTHLSPLGQKEVPMVPAGSVLVVSTAWSISKIGITAVECSTNQQITAVESPDCSEYLYYLLQAAREEILASMVLNRLPIIGNARLGAVKLPIPPVIEQQAIAKELSSVAERIDALTHKAREVVETLRERRAALISAAVTGKIDVRGL